MLDLEEVLLKDFLLGFVHSTIRFLEDIFKFATPNRAGSKSRIISFSDTNEESQRDDVEMFCDVSRIDFLG